MPRKKINIGDVFEIKVSSGFAYGVYTNYHADAPSYGTLVRVFDRIFAQQLTDVDRLLELPIRFETFFPLQAAVNKGLFPIVGNLKLPDTLQSFPLFRAGSVDPKTRKVASWWLWDGKKEWPIGALHPEQRRLPIRGIWNATFLIDRIEQGWRPETDRS